MLRVCGIGHIKHYILDTGRLSSRPVYSHHAGISRYGRRVYDKISDLSPEDIGGSVSKTVCSVRISIDNTQATRPVGRCLDGWRAYWVSDELGIVPVDDRTVCEICSGWEVDDRWSDGSRRTRAGCTAVTAGYGGLNRCRVISHTVA